MSIALLVGLGYFGPLEGTAAQNQKISLMQARMVDAANARMRAEQRLEQHQSERINLPPESQKAATQVAKELQAAVDQAAENEAKSKRTVSKVANATPDPAGIVFAAGALVAFTLLLILLTAISRWAALGCLGLVLLGVSGAVAIFAIRSWSGPRAPKIGALFNSTATSTVAHFHSIGVERGLETLLTGEFTLRPELPGWEPWFVIAYRQPIGGNLRSGGHTSAKITPGNRFKLRLHEIKWDARCDAAINYMKREFVLVPGKPAEILGFNDADGQQIQVMLELRPKSDLGRTLPGSQLFIRDVRSSVKDGYIDVAWNELMSTRDYQLVVETWGASARLGSMPVIDPQRTPVTEPAEFRYTRQRISSDGTCRFDFPPTVGGEVFIADPGDNMLISNHGGFLFEVRAADSSYIAKAHFRLTKTDSQMWKEVLPAEKGDTVPSPGSALPPPPPGAEFIAEQPVTIPANQTIRILTEKNPDGQLGELLHDITFKTPVDDAQGIIIRWRGYPSFDGKPSRFIIDFVSRANGMTFSRIEAGAYHFLTSPHKKSLPARNKPASLVQPGAQTTVSLMRDSTDGIATYSAEIECEIQWIDPHLDPDSKPTLQLQGVNP